jgi:hypothetical protein
MTRKDYVLIADALRNSRPAVEILLVGPNRVNQWISTVGCVVSMLASDNDRFDSVKFYDRAGYTSLMEYTEGDGYAKETA